MKKSPDNTLLIEYYFKFLNGEEKFFEIELDEHTLQLRPRLKGEAPDWTRLTHRQCPNCPLDPAQHSHCPVAVNLVDLVESFSENASYQEAEIRVCTENREYRKHTAIQYGVSALMGLRMVTSGCPILDKLRPMVHSHLPFATIQETLYRFMSMYLLAQYYVQQEGGTPDWALKNLPQLFEEIGLVNKSFYQRLEGVTRTSDAVNNALVNLDCYALLTTMPVGDHTSCIKSMFHAWELSPPAHPPEGPPQPPT